MLPPVYSIGPLHLLLNQVTDSDLKLIGSNLWVEEAGCLEWLDSKEARLSCLRKFWKHNCHDK
ncbi:hypothetical protein OIU77_025467 [Salix suchowensis]|uniref:Uncharacterized protein n=1 Tax=Salix suchowensis TaxID=1278906 RepID=A0ABQ9BWD5_9ROSI|nr:hypothetical protein OIU77_025467 [Salix suchowensis]